MIDSLKDFIVLDLDGTVADVSHRVHLAQAKAWDDFHAACVYDKVVEATAQIISQLSNYNFIMVTGRTERHRPATERWLEDNQLARYIHTLLMRGDDDFRQDGEMKLALLEEYFGSKQSVLNNVLLCLDDRDRVVEAFRNYGLTCWQVREGDY